MSRSFCAAILVLMVANLACAASWDDDSHYVSLGSRNGYIVQPDWYLFRQLDPYEASVMDAADPLCLGERGDVLAFRFNRNGVLIAYPAHVAQPCGTTLSLFIILSKSGAAVVRQILDGSAKIGLQPFAPRDLI